MTDSTKTVDRPTFIAWFYIIGGAIGVIMSISSIAQSNIGVLGAVAWLVLLSQLAAAIFGGVETLKGNERGLQLLYWVSLSCIPVLESPVLDYYCAIGFGFLPNFTFGVGVSGVNFPLQFGYYSNLAYFTGGSYITLGINVVALAIFMRMRAVLRSSDVVRWPLRSRVA